MTYPRERKVFADCELAVRDWLKDDPYVSELVARRVFFRIPKDNVTFPMIIVNLVDGGPESDGPAVDESIIQIECLSKKDKGEAAAIKNAVVSSIESLECGDLMGSQARAIWAFVDRAIWNPQEEAEISRYDINAGFAVSAVSPETAEI